MHSLTKDNKKANKKIVLKFRLTPEPNTSARWIIEACMIKNLSKHVLIKQYS